MLKQTVEEAANLYTLNEMYNFESLELAAKDGFIDGASWEKEQSIDWLSNNLPSEDTGRAGCTYNDTEYDSLSVVYGYNLALQHVKENISKISKTDK